MSFNIKNVLFNLFSKYDKDFDNSGLLERFNDLVASDFDSNELKKIKNIYELCLLADTCEEKLLPYLEALFGIPFITNNVKFRRKIIKNILDIYKNKGNYRSYDLLFKCLGYGGATLEKLNGYDYRLKLSNNLPLISEDITTIINAIGVIEPLYSGIYSIFADKDYDVFYIFIENGDLYYNALFDTSFFMVNGDLWLRNNTIYNYYINNNGDLIKN